MNILRRIPSNSVIKKLPLSTIIRLKYLRNVICDECEREAATKKGEKVASYDCKSASYNDPLSCSQRLITAMLITIITLL